MRRTKTAEKALMMLGKVMGADEMQKLVEMAEKVAEKRRATMLGFRHVVEVMRSW